LNKGAPRRAKGGTGLLQKCLRPLYFQDSGQIVAEKKTW